MRFRYQVVTLTTNTLTIEEQICPDPGDLWDDTKNLVTITKWHNDGADEGRLESKAWGRNRYNCKDWAKEAAANCGLDCN